MKRILSLMIALTLVLSLTACGSKNTHVDVKSLYESYGEYLPEMYIPDEGMLLDYLGIRAEECLQYQVAMCAEGLRVDEVWLIEAKDATALENLRKLAQSRINSRLDETESYVPDQYAVVQKAALLTNGLYLALLISPEVDAMQTKFEAAFQ